MPFERREPEPNHVLDVREPFDHVARHERLARAGRRFNEQVAVVVDGVCPAGRDRSEPRREAPLAWLNRFTPLSMASS